MAPSEASPMIFSEGASTAPSDASPMIRIARAEPALEHGVVWPVTWTLCAARACGTTCRTS